MRTFLLFVAVIALLGIHHTLERIDRRLASFDVEIPSQ